MELTNKISPKEALKDFEFAVVNFYDRSEESKAFQPIFEMAESLYKRDR